MYAINVVIIAQAPYLSIIYNTFNVLPAIVSVIQLQKRTGHSDEQQNLNKMLVLFSSNSTRSPTVCLSVHFPFEITKEMTPWNRVLLAKHQPLRWPRNDPIFMESESLSSCSNEPTTSYYSLRSILIPIHARP